VDGSFPSHLGHGQRGKGEKRKRFLLSFLERERREEGEKGLDKKRKRSSFFLLTSMGEGGGRNQYQKA